MSEDLTKNLPASDSEKLTEILSTVLRLDSRVERLYSKVESLDSRTETLDSRVENLGSRVERLESTVERLDSRLSGLEQNVDERLYDTRPFWETVVADIAQLQAGQERLTEGLERLTEGQLRLTEGLERLTEGQERLTEGQQRLEDGLEFLSGESREIRTLLRDIFRRLSIFNDTLVTMQADYRDIYDRVREIERQR